MIDKLKASLEALVSEVIAEAARNPRFAQRVSASLGIDERYMAAAPRVGAGGRRAAAVVDPIELARNGEQNLREKLTELNLEQLKDVVADFGMDQGKLVMKWKTRERIIDRIIEFSMSRAVKGDVFLK
jgi:hypothetical protein